MIDWHTAATSTKYKHRIKQITCR